MICYCLYEAWSQHTPCHCNTPPRCERARRATSRATTVAPPGDGVLDRRTERCRLDWRRVARAPGNRRPDRVTTSIRTIIDRC